MEILTYFRLNSFELFFPAIYMFTVSIISIALTLLDKKRAIKGEFRISENILLLFSLLGGSTAMLITMKLCRHKTKHKKFMLGIPLIILLQFSALIAVLFIKKGG